MKKMSITNRITIVFIVVFLSVLMLDFAMIQGEYSNWKESVTNNAQIAIEKSSEAINQRLQTVYKNIKETALIAQSLDFMLYENPSDLVLTRNRMHKQLSVMLRTNSDMDVLCIYSEDNLYVSIYGQNLKVNERIFFTNILKNNQFPACSDSWGILKIDNTVFLIREYTYGEYRVCTAVKFSNLQTALQKYGDNSYYCFSIPGESDFYTTEESTKNIKQLELSNLLPDPEVNIKYIVDINEGVSFLSGTRVLSILAIMMGASGIFAIILIVRHTLTRPINRLLVLTEQVINGNYTSRVDNTGISPDFIKLNTAVNNMLDELSELRIEKYEREIEIQSQELKLLRSQIRPHFFLNSLSLINNLTYTNRNEDIRKYIEMLSEHLRYTFSIDKQLIPLNQELYLVDNYIKMQEIRFPNSVKYSYEGDPKCDSVPIMHLMLITIVENSMKHSMNLYEELELSIKSEVVILDGKKYCKIGITDNGHGFPEEMIAAFGNEELNSSSVIAQPIGLLNVKKTLKLLFGPYNSMMISNVEPHGAQVIFLIPLSDNSEANYEITDS